MTTRSDILKKEDINQLVDRFYEKVREDRLLAPIFKSRIKDDWNKHLDKMYRFWQTVLLGDLQYQGSPFPPHAGLPIDQQHFDKWLELFFTTIDDLFEGEKAEEAKWRATKMAELFEAKIRYSRDNPSNSLI